jgi:hypothetical protein
MVVFSVLRWPPRTGGWVCVGRWHRCPARRLRAHSHRVKRCSRRLACGRSCPGPTIDCMTGRQHAVSTASGGDQQPSAARTHHGSAYERCRPGRERERGDLAAFGCGTIVACSLARTPRTGSNPGSKLSASDGNSAAVNSVPHHSNALRNTGTLRLGAGRSSRAAPPSTGAAKRVLLLGGWRRVVCARNSPRRARD